MAAGREAASQPEAVRAIRRVRRLEVAPNGRYLQCAGGEPFFWLADTGWLLFTRLRRDEADRYLTDRRRKGFNVIQVMVLPGLPCANAYGQVPFIEQDPARPLTLTGATPTKAGDPGAAAAGGRDAPVDYWDHIDWIVDRAAELELYMAMVPAWGSVVKRQKLNLDNAAAYGAWLGERCRDKPNVVWLNGGDTRGDQHTAVWQALGAAIKRADPGHLMTFHPFGRTQSSQWFHEADWLDFNMCQSGHRRYDQADPDDLVGEDNFKYIQADWQRRPVKPVLDGEPSYEGIPQGLHDPKEPFWQAADARRYAYWAVFAGACGHTYGNGSVMQMHAPEHGIGGYGVTKYWFEAIDDPGAGQMQHLKNLLLSRPYFARVPDQTLVAADEGERYDRLLATRGDGYAMIYTYTGRPFALDLGQLDGDRLRAWWFDPRTGRAESLGTLPKTGSRRFAPPGEPAPGNDWVLVLDDAACDFGPPGGRASEMAVWLLSG